jgi:hypothetical protein
MHGILTLAASSGGSDVLSIIGFIAIPLFLALCTGVFALNKGLLRFTQFMTRSEATSRSVADSNIEIRDKLAETNTQLQEFADKTNIRLGDHDRMLAVLNYVLGRNGNIAERTVAQADQMSATTAEAVRQDRENGTAAGA